jgi:hypothetical protein
VGATLRGRRWTEAVASLARVEEGRGGRTHLKITITPEIDSVKGSNAMTFGRYGKDAAVGCAAIGADKAPKGSHPHGGLDREEAEDVPQKRLQDNDSMLWRASGGFMRCAELYKTVTGWSIL